MRILSFTLLLSLCLSFTLEGQISFRQASYNQCKTTAISSQLPFVVYVTARWCLNCKLMEETTFRSQGLKFAVDGKYNTYKIDFDSHAANDWKRKFGIHAVPAFLVFDKDGEMVQRVDKSLTSTKIIDLLNNPHQFSSEQSFTANTNYHTEYAAGPYKNDFYNWTVESKKFNANSNTIVHSEPTTIKKAIKEDLPFMEENDSYQNEEQKLSFYLTPSDVKIVEEFMTEQVKIPATNSRLIKQAKNNLTTSPSQLEKFVNYFSRINNLYTTKLRNEESDADNNKQQVEFGNKMYRIQYGIFANIDDATGLVNELRRQQPHPIFTLYESRAGKPIYRVVIGKFPTYQEANIVKDEIFIKGLQATVIEI